MDDILLTLLDTPLDTQTPSPLELMFNRKVKTNLPSIPLFLFDTSASIQAGHCAIKHAEAENQSRSDPSHPEPYHAVTCIWKLQHKRAKWNSGTVKFVDGYRSYTIKGNTTEAEYSRERSHLEQLPAAHNGIWTWTRRCRLYTSFVCILGTKDPHRTTSETCFNSQPKSRPVRKCRTRVPQGLCN